MLIDFKDIYYKILPMLKSVQYFAYSLFYAWAIHLRNKMDMPTCLFDFEVFSM